MTGPARYPRDKTAELARMAAERDARVARAGTEKPAPARTDSIRPSTRPTPSKAAGGLSAPVASGQAPNNPHTPARVSAAGEAGSAPTPTTRGVVAHVRGRVTYAARPALDAEQGRARAALVKLAAHGDAEVRAVGDRLAAELVAALGMVADAAEQAHPPTRERTRRLARKIAGRPAQLQPDERGQGGA